MISDLLISEFGAEPGSGVLPVLHKGPLLSRHHIEQSLRRVYLKHLDELERRDVVLLVRDCLVLLLARDAPHSHGLVVYLDVGGH